MALYILSRENNSVLMEGGDSYCGHTFASEPLGLSFVYQIELYLLIELDASSWTGFASLF